MEGAGQGEHGGRNKACSKQEVKWGLAEDTGKETYLWAQGIPPTQLFISVLCEGVMWLPVGEKVTINM